MNLCPGCAAPIVEGSLFCDRCGQRVDNPVEDTTSRGYAPDQTIEPDSGGAG